MIRFFAGKTFLYRPDTGKVRLRLDHAGSFDKRRTEYTDTALSGGGSSGAGSTAADGVSDSGTGTAAVPRKYAS